MKPATVRWWIRLYTDQEPPAELRALLDRPLNRLPRRQLRPLVKWLHQVNPDQELRGDPFK